MRDENVVLRLEGICKEFPGVKALQNVEFTLHKGEIHALMGENGAGKSTLIKVLTGVYEKDGGDIYMSDNPEPVIIRSTQDAQKAGISTVYQEITLCPNLTVAENMYIGRSKGAFTKWKKMYSDAGKLLESLDIPARPNQQLGSCSLAVQQMVAIARAVDMDCKVLILDEPTSSLDEQEVEKLFKLMLDLKSRGVGIIFVTHFLDQVYAVCDKITVLRDGKFEGEYNAADLPKVELVSKMLGNELGMKVTHFTSAESAQERSRIKTQFANADPYQAIVAIKCLDEGVNIPSIKTAFILASSTNPKEYIQRRGRVLRKYKGKKFAVIYDFVTLPTAIDDVQYGSDGSNFDLSLVKREMVRMKEFGEISMNPADTDKLISELSDAYGMDIIDLDEGVYDYE